MSWEAWGSPPEPEPEHCPLCGSDHYTEGCPHCDEVNARITLQAILAELVRLKDLKAECLRIRQRRPCSVKRRFPQDLLDDEASYRKRSPLAWNAARAAAYADPSAMRGGALASTNDSTGATQPAPSGAALQESQSMNTPTKPKFTFSLGQQVVISASGEQGTVVARAEYLNSEDAYYIRYKAADGRATEAWWPDSALNR